MRRRDVTASLATAFAGSLTCIDPDCPRSDASPCGYVDDSGTACSCAFCPDHLAVIDGIAYCLRHASTLRALEGSNLRPGVTNRCPSLVYWVSNGLDARIREILNAHRNALGETIFCSPIHPADHDGSASGRVWRREWSLSSGDQHRLVIGIEVAESEPSDVAATLDGKQVGRWIPPWITYRDQKISHEMDAEQRRGFNEGIVFAIESEIRTRKTVSATG